MAEGVTSGASQASLTLHVVSHMVSLPACRFQISQSSYFVFTVSKAQRDRQLHVSQEKTTSLKEKKDRSSLGSHAASLRYHYDQLIFRRRGIRFSLSEEYQRICGLCCKITRS